MKQTKQLLKVIVGSQAHGLATPESDTDYRGVYILPTSQLLSIGQGKISGTQWTEGDSEDNTAWELAHFLHLATHSNPTILETFLSPVQETTPEGDKLRNLFEHVWSSIGVKNAFVGYGLNQRKKFLDRKDARPAKYAAAYLRSLYNGVELLRTGIFTVKISDTPIGETVRRFKHGLYESMGEVITECIKWEDEINKAYEENPDKTTNLEPINEYLLEVRKNNWAFNENTK